MSDANEQQFDLSNQPQPRARRILVADDDASVRRLLEVVLTRHGYLVSTAEDGAAALQKALDNQFDLAVLDAMMPNLSGYDLCRILRSYPNFQDLRIIILSGLGGEAGNDADVYLLKTVNMQDELLNAVSNLLTNRAV